MLELETWFASDILQDAARSRTGRRDESFARQPKGPKVHGLLVEAEGRQWDEEDEGPLLGLAANAVMSSPGRRRRSPTGSRTSGSVWKLMLSKAHAPPCVPMATLWLRPACFPKTKMRHGMKNRCELRTELCVASDDLICTADWLWFLNLGAWWAEPPEVRFQVDVAEKEEKLSFNSSCFSEFSRPRARPHKHTVLKFPEDVPMLMRADPEVQVFGDAGIEPATETKPDGPSRRSGRPETSSQWSARTSDPQLEAVMVPPRASWGRSHQTGQSEQQGAEVDQSQNLPSLDWFCWDGREEDFTKKLSQIILNVN